MVEAFDPTTLEVSWHPDSTFFIKQVSDFSCVTSMVDTLIAAQINLKLALLEALECGDQIVR